MASTYLKHISEES